MFLLHSADVRDRRGRSRQARPHRVDRCGARGHHDYHGPRSRAGFFRQFRAESYGPGHDYDSAVFHALDYAFLRAGIFSAHRHGRISRVAEKVETRTVRISFHARPLADFSGDRSDPLFRMAVQSRLSRDVPDRSVGAGLGDDHVVAAGVLAWVGSDGIWRGDDCDPQSVRFRGIVQLALDNSAFSEFSAESSAAQHFRWLSADSLDWRYGGGLWTRTDLQLAVGAAAGVPVAVGPGADSDVHHFACD